MIARKIKYQRKYRANMSQGRLANILNVSRSTVNNWECGSAMPTLQHLILMSYLFNVSINYFPDDSIELDELILNQLTEEQKDVIYSLIYIYS